MCSFLKIITKLDLFTNKSTNEVYIYKYLFIYFFFCNIDVIYELFFSLNPKQNLLPENLQISLY